MSSALALKNMQAAGRTAEGLRRQAIATAPKNPELAVSQLAQALAAFAGMRMFQEEAVMLAIAEAAEKSGDMLASKKIRNAATEFRLRATRMPVKGSPEENNADISAMAKSMLDKHYPQVTRALDGFDGLDGFGSWVKSAVNTVGKVIKAAPAAMANVTLLPVHSIVRPLAWAGVPAAKNAVKKLDQMTLWMERNPAKALVAQAAVAAAAVGGGAIIAGATGAAGAGGAGAAAASTAGAGGAAGAAATGAGITAGGALTTAVEIAPIAIGVAKGLQPSKQPTPPDPPAGDPSIPQSIVNPDGSVVIAVPDGQGGVKYVPMDPATGGPKRFMAASMFDFGKNWAYWLAGATVVGILAMVLFPPQRPQQPAPMT